MPAEWFHAQAGGEKSGPVEAAVLNQKFAREELDRERTLVWRRGMKEWQTAADQDEFALELPPVPTASVPLSTASSNQNEADLPATPPQHKWLTTRRLFTLFALFQLTGISLFYSVLVKNLPEDFQENPPELAEFQAILSQESVIKEAIPAFLLYGVSAVLAALIVYRAWTVLRPSDEKMPKLAGGLMLVPFLNLIWRFQAYWKWSQEWNKKPQLESIKRQPERLFLYCCIALAMGSWFPLIAFVGVVLNWVSLFKMSRAADLDSHKA